MAGDPTSTAPRPATPDGADGPGSADRPARQESLALYRRYRPASFAEVKGQEQVTEPLTRALKAGRINHAYLFSGPRGCGKTTSARILARSLNCAQGPTPQPCGVCESCIALAPNGPGSIDVIEIDAASHGGVDDARDLRERAFYAPVSGRFKVYIIDEAHMVTREGFNALLKLVEEPPAHLKFIFATTEPEKVIATIRSRTHHYPFRLVPPAVLRELLGDILTKERVKWDADALQLVIRAGAGSVRDSLSVLDQLLAGSDESGLTYDKTAFLLGYTDASLLDEVTEAFADGDGAAVFHAVDRVVEAGLDPRRFAADMLDRLRDLIVLNAVPDADKTGLIDAPADRLERMRGQAARLGQAELTRAAEVLSEGLVQMRGATAPRLLLELMCARMLLPGASQDHSALLARLERLERGAPPSSRPSPGPPADVADPPPVRASDPPPVRASDPPPVRASQPSRRAPEPPADPPPTSPSPPSAPPVSAPTPGPEAAPPASAAPPPASTAGLERDWNRVLGAVMKVRKVAWMLLRNATVQSLTDGVLTVRFAREGDVKGFVASGCDADLERVLAGSFGLKVKVRAVAAGDRDPESAGRNPENSFRTVASQPPSPPPAPADASQNQPVPVPPTPPPAPVTPHPPPPPSASPSPPPPRVPPNEDDDVPFDITDPDASAGQADLTGMDLIRRELGGEIIDEIDNS
jgi:DNA polymerase-3 subunit gamma/tau